MFEEEMPESDSSDEDFVPTGHGSDVSEEDSDNAIDEDQNDEPQSLPSKRKKLKSSKPKRKKKKKDDEDIVQEEEEDNIKEEIVEETPEEKKRKADALWADFLKDCDPPAKKKTDTSRISSTSVKISSKPDSQHENSKDSTCSSSSSSEDRLHPKISDDKKDDVTPSNAEEEEKNVEIYEFAGEKVVVEKKMDPRRAVARGGLRGRGGGAAAILSQINKKNKLSTLEKSKLDWETFKDKEGINEQLSTHNRGKNGYLEKQDFLQRADLRQFEIEKQMREYSRSKRV